jgi:hypothetical protein
VQVPLKDDAAAAAYMAFLQAQLRAVEAQLQAAEEEMAAGDLAAALAELPCAKRARLVRCCILLARVAAFAFA